MSEMIERVAKAKWARRQEVGRKAGIELADWEDELESLREEVREEARCGFEAMREPTEAMKLAGDEILPDHIGFDDDASNAYRAMIDAALN